MIFQQKPLQEKTDTVRKCISPSMLYSRCSMADLMWCDRCGAVEYSIETDRDTGYREAYCDVCGGVLELEAKKCQCGEWISEESTACPVCKDITRSAIRNIFAELESVGWNDEGISDLIDEEAGDYLYGVRRFKTSK